PAISRWRPARGLAKGVAKRAVLHIAQAQRDFGDRGCAIRQQELGNLHALLHLILVRRYAEGLFECAAEVMEAEPTQLRELHQADLLAQMRFDVVDDRAP